VERRGACTVLCGLDDEVLRDVRCRREATVEACEGAVQCCHIGSAVYLSPIGWDGVELSKNLELLPEHRVRLQVACLAIAVAQGSRPMTMAAKKSVTFEGCLIGFGDCTVAFALA
jgi:hypothetical protein